jgi:LysR family transcriptional regulator, regulator for bpeEF and oprC
MLTPAGESLMARSVAALGELGEALDYVGSLSTEAHGTLRISAGIGFGINVLAAQLPAFLEQYPKVDVVVDLTSHMTDLVAERVDVAIRFGTLADSSMVAVRLGEMKRVLCAAPDYIDRKGMPRQLGDLTSLDSLDMPDADGRSRIWRFERDGLTRDVAVPARALVNDALTIHRMTVGGAGIAIISCYLCAPDLAEGRLIHLLPEWTPPPIAVNMVFPSKRELAPVVRAFVDYMKEANPPGLHWQNNGLLHFNVA